MRNFIRTMLLLLCFVISAGQGTVGGQTTNTQEHDLKIQKAIGTFYVGEKIAVRPYHQPGSTGVFVQTSLSELVYTETATNTTRHIPISEIRSVHEIRKGHHVALAIYVALVVGAGVGTALAVH